MALAKNLNSKKLNRRNPSSKRGKRDFRKIILYSSLGLAVLLGVYGVLNLSRLVPDEDQKQDLVLSTGDRPLPEEMKIWINAKGGLNLRELPDGNSKIIAIIPNGTELVSTKLSGDWYEVKFEGKTGWVHRDYVKNFKEEDVPQKDDWKVYRSPNYGYTASYPKDWVYLSYGANKAAGLLDYVAFGLQLSDELDPNRLPPIAIKVTSDSNSVVTSLYKKKTDVVYEKSKIAGIDGFKYVFIAESGVQMTAYIVSGDSYTYILQESGGYASELERMVSEFKFS